MERGGKKFDYKPYGWKTDDDLPSPPDASGMPIPTDRDLPIPDTSALTSAAVRLPAEFVDLESEETPVFDFAFDEPRKKKKRRKKKKKRQKQSKRKRNPLLSTACNIATFLSIYCIVTSCGNQQMFFIGVVFLIISWQIEKYYSDNQDSKS